jgi:5-methylcytosine-specific restriction endonuclease McrA
MKKLESCFENMLASPPTNILDRDIVLTLNKCWIPVGLTTPQKAVSGLYSETLCGLDIEYSIDERGEYDFTNPLSIIPKEWNEWKDLPIRPCDMSITTVNAKYRVPNIVIAHNYTETRAVRPPRLSRKNILLRDGYRCAYTNKTYHEKELNIDHIVPKSRGGRTEWHNLITCHQKVNAKKGDRTPEEAGLNLCFRPYRPTTLQLVLKQKKCDSRWMPFIQQFT